MKTTDQIFEDMLALFKRETGYDMEDSADLAVRLKAASAELFSLYRYTDWMGRMTFPQTAEGNYLDHHAQLRGLTRKSAARARGVIRFYIGQALGYDVPIPLGTVCSAGALVDFETTKAGIIATGSLYADVQAEALLPGAPGNVRAGTVAAMPLPPTGVSGCTNPEPFSGGADGEDDEALRERVLDTYKRLPNGANAAYYENLVLENEQVCACRVIPRIGGVGTVGVVVTAVQGVSEEALAARLQAELSEIREIAVAVTVKTPEEVAVSISLCLAAAEGYGYDGVAAAVRRAVEGHFTRRLLAKPLLLRDLYAILNKVEGLSNYTVDLPVGDVFVNEEQIPVLEVLNLRRMGG